MREPPKRIAGIDFGMARLGLALSDESKILATPIGTLQGTKKLQQTVQIVVDELKKLEERYGCQIVEVVVGLPLMMDGSIGLLADEVKHFAGHLRHASGKTVTLWDERLTSVQADRVLREGGLSRKKRTQHVDYVAAVVILQSYLDRLSFIRAQESAGPS